MNAYHLAKLVEWAGTLKTRKRLQKVVYLLRHAGCPLNVDFTLHHYGPYSHDVAQRADAMVQAGLLEEEETSNTIGRSFSYKLSQTARQQLNNMDNAIRQKYEEFDRFKPLAQQLLQHDLQKLEFSATIAYFRNQGQGRTWLTAREAASKFKNQEPNGQDMRDAEGLAKQVLEWEIPG
ncbi:MAG: hypothetical protein MI923_22910 [Phycisphaerales bacterium]|nr:hypothetical protein [Phycisphaerales bacterium]